MNISTHPVQGEAMLDALYALNQYSLHPNPPFQNKDEWAAIVRERKGVTCHVTFEAETPISVATHPSARRKGNCRQTIASLLAVERETGKIFSHLYPFRESFYEPLGYVAFPLTKIAKFAP
jgi:Acetyltransferase (GNAT) domain